MLAQNKTKTKTSTYGSYFISSQVTAATLSARQFANPSGKYTPVFKDQDSIYKNLWFTVPSLL